MAQKIYTKLQTIADNVQKVFDSGVAKGHSEGYSEGYNKGNDVGYEAGHTEGYNTGHEEGYSEGTEAGKQAQEKAFWDKFLFYSDTANCNYMFAGQGWVEQTFRPNKDLVPVQSSGMFYSFMAHIGDFNKAIDLVRHLETLGVKLDFSKSTALSSCFNWAMFKRVGVIDCSKSSNLSSTFANAKIGQIDKLIVHEALTYGSAFQNLSKLTHMIVEGVIGKSGFNVQWATSLDKESLTSIVNCLSATTTGLTITLSLTAVNKAFETSEGAKDGSTSTEWTSLTSAHQNWTISLV